MLLALSNRSQALAELTDQVTLAKKQAHDVRVLRNGLGGSVDAANFLAKQRAQQPTIIELLNDLTTRIPDDTVLEKISFNEGRVVLVGQSRQAAALVGLLQASALIKTPALAGAMQPDPRTGMDRFTLTATVIGSPQEVADGNAQANR
jgi:general secretion pathway protein L